MTTPLPIDAALPDLIAALRQSRRAVLHAPPGAGKTTRVPLAMLDAELCDGRILMLEPRRLATRMAATRMAETLGQAPGETVGYRMRGETKTSHATRIEVVTEGILTRMIQSDPELSGIGAVIFDEFHERSLHADLGLALALEVATAFRPDLLLLVMSATLDTGPVAALLGDAPVVTSEGRSFPVEERHLDRPLPRDRRFEDAMADLIARAHADEPGDILAFLPGAPEITRVAAKIAGLGDIRPLYGALPFAQQRAALAPASHRRIVLATSIAETSLTIPGVRIVIDGGLARRARFDPGSGMTRLVTERVSRAEATQRAGRAGRVEPGVCYRLWTKGEAGALPPFAPAEIEVADLAGLALDLAEWGTGDLAFLTPPPDAGLARARELLRDLGALDGDSITPHGRALARMPTHPRLAHMLAVAGQDAAPLAALLSEPDPLRGTGADLTLRLRALRSDDPRLSAIAREAKRLARLAPDPRGLSPAQQAALAYPDRIALRRPGDAPRWLLANGKGARMDAGDPLAAARLLVVTDTDGHPREALIRQAIEIGEPDLREVMADRIETIREVTWDPRTARVRAVEEERLGALPLSSKPWRDAPEDRTTAAMLDGIRTLGLPASRATDLFRKRAALARATGADLPDLSDDALLATLDDWLAPYLAGVTSAEAWRGFDILPALRARLDWSQTQALDAAAPRHWTTPLGREIPIDYDDGTPNVSLRLQEVFGLTRHPMIAGQPLRMTLLSPAGRPLQTTTDLPGFWATSYLDVRKDMRGRYPRHPWPEDPASAAPTTRTKAR